MGIKFYPGADIERQDGEMEKAKALAAHILQECEEQELSQFVVEQIPDMLQSLIDIQKTKRSLTERFTAC